MSTISTLTTAPRDACSASPADSVAAASPTRAKAAGARGAAGETTRGGRTRGGRTRGTGHRAAEAHVRRVRSSLAPPRPVPATRRPGGLQPPTALPARSGVPVTAPGVGGAGTAGSTGTAGGPATRASSVGAPIESRPVVPFAATSVACRAAPRSAAGITRRGRLLVTALLLGVTALLISVAGVAVAGASGSGDTPIVYSTITLEPGQSLWEVARSVAPDSDPRSTIARIVELNDLTSPSDVRAGQQIAVPSALRG